MLELKGIKKDYPAGSGVVHALKGIDLRFRKSEFVSILGQSGCGKTTMLNIIGGLDGYTEGDLIINGVSTKKYKDRDWDSYRNHSIGFVFQSYNLIPHQTVLQNVEIALSLSGVPKKERRARAKKALEDVGLGDQLNKKPSAMSGGQMQRVAIARALVNNPDIILADEPTGALDTETSVQVMEILKEISKDRLIIMVTHNPELAEKYSSRIIRMLDGLITDDSNPMSEDEIKSDDQQAEAGVDAKKSESSEKSEDGQKKAETKAAKKPKREKKPSMKFSTSFMLSLKNLFTKKGRTLLTAFAGSIGIIGIALILAISTGMTTYINDVQESTLSGYPLTLEAKTIEMSALVESFMNVQEDNQEHELDAVYKKTALSDMISAMNGVEESENDLKAFNDYLTAQVADENTDLHEAVNGIQYTYDIRPIIYTENVDGEITDTNLEQVLIDLFIKYLDVDMSAMSSTSALGTSSMGQMRNSMTTMMTTLYQELLPGLNGEPVNDLILDQYEVVYGSWPNSYDEVVLVVDQNNELDDIVLYTLGLLPAEDLDNLAQVAVNGGELEDDGTTQWSFEEICSREYRVILNSDCYSYDEATGLYTDLRDTEAGLRYLYDNGLSLKVTGIVRLREDADTRMLTGSICYTSDLTEYIIEKSEGSEVIKAQMDSPDRDVITGLPFDTTTGTLEDEEKEKEFREFVENMNAADKASIFISINCIPDPAFVEQQIEAAFGDMTRADMEAMLLENIGTQVGVSEDEITDYLENMSDEEFEEMFNQLATEQIKAQYAQQVMTQMATLSPEELLMGLEASLPTYTTEQCAQYYDELVEFSDSSYDANLLAMGYVQLEHPATINIYASSFENKDIITDAIKNYNNSVEELKQIKYTDYLGIMMSSITTIINAITYVLIAFVAISLIVSSIMIGVITLISVQERTKEIGILRAIGASKKNVSSMFNAETMIVGFASGLLGVIVTYLLCIPINMIMHHVTGIENLNAILPVPAAVILVIISVCLTLISGIIPSRSAAKKDPVVALRTE
ncbi:MAG: ABC transporter ATP-binding protein/permease [Lachnospiraceae bacterium]|nr:ABC transporter ATP-binding protein/permease [Lachnospiraceae bacterium]